MNKNQESKSIGRRDFFRRAGLGAGAIGVAAAGLSKVQPTAAQPAKRASGAGYRETEHVKKFYELARF